MNILPTNRNKDAGLLFTSIMKSIASLTAPGVGVIFVKSIIISVVALVAFVITVTFITAQIAPMIHSDYSRHLSWIAGLGSTIIAWILFPGIMPFIAGFFSNDIIEVIERQDYQPVPVNANSFMSDLGFDTKFAIKALLLNILVLPLYLLPGVNIFVFYSLNGYLLGKQFYLAAARRHMNINKAAELRRKHGRAVFSGGVMIAFLATVPIVNLLVPFWGVALMTHMFHVSNREQF